MSIWYFTNPFIKVYRFILFTIDKLLFKFLQNAPVAQLDRVPDYESGGRGFESSPVRHIQGPKSMYHYYSGS